MKELIPMTSNGLFVNTDKEVMIDSRYIAETFDIKHKNLKRDIVNLLNRLQECSENADTLKFERTYYKDKQGKRVM